MGIGVNRSQFIGSEKELKKEQAFLIVLTESVTALFTRSIAKNNSWSKRKKNPSNILLFFAFSLIC